MDKVVLAGGSGALGRRIAADLRERGDEVVVLTRTVQPGLPYRQIAWDGATVGPWAEELPGSVLINLAGALVDRRPNRANVDLLTRSRVDPTRALVEAAAGQPKPPRVWLQMSTLAIYGDSGDTVLDERAPVADGPPQMAGVARGWEEAATDPPAERQVIMRTGVTFAPGTPALDRLVNLVRWGLASGRIGTGRQWVSWIHVADFLAAVRRLIDGPDLSGIVHVTGPEPVRNAELMAALRAVLRRPLSVATPAPLVRLGALLLGTDPALALTGRRCLPAKLQAAGFRFAHPALEPALVDLIVGRR